jgi:hypothetical protein
MAKGTLLITCVSEDGIHFSKDVYDYLYSKLEQESTQITEDESKKMNVAKDMITLNIKNEEEGQIYIDRSAHIPQEMVKNILKSFLESDPTRFKDYDVFELGETLTIGRVLHPSKMEMLTCEICGFFTPYIEELYTHRMTHFGV